MRLLIAALLSAVTFTASAGHSHSPISYGGKEDIQKAITLDGVVIVPIRVGSLKTAKEFQLSVDGLNLEKVLIGKDQVRTFRVAVQAVEPNRPEVHKVCSTALGDISTRMCTKVKIYWWKK